MLQETRAKGRHLSRPKTILLYAVTTEQGTRVPNVRKRPGYTVYLTKTNPRIGGAISIQRPVNTGLRGGQTRHAVTPSSGSLSRGSTTCVRGRDPCVGHRVDDT